MLRAFGRAKNPTYVQFNENFKKIIENYNEKTKVYAFFYTYFFFNTVQLKLTILFISQKELQNYEFDYSAWPIDFDWKNNNKYVNISENVLLFQHVIYNRR